VSLATRGDFSARGSAVISDTFYPLYRRMFRRDSAFVTRFEDTLSAARIRDPVELYLARSLGIAVAFGFLLWVTGTLLAYVLVQQFLPSPPTFIGLRLPPTVLPYVQAAKLPLLVGLSGVVLGTLGFTLSFGTTLLVPYMQAGAREREINLLLADAISFMYALSAGGVDQLEILEAMAKAEDTYGEVAREFRNIVLETQYFDTDYRTAIRNQALQTPSSELSQFLTDMLSVINSGGDMERFFAEKKEKHMRTSKQQQQDILETLELMGEVYMTISLLPLLLIIIFVLMSMLGRADPSLMYATVYGLIPMLGLFFLVIVATIKQDDPGTGYLADDERGTERAERPNAFDLGPIERYAGEGAIFDRIKRYEGSYQTKDILRSPHLFFREHPAYTLVLTVPFALVLIALAVLFGMVPTSWEGAVSQPLLSTVVYLYLPLYVVLLPLGAFHEWNLATRRRILTELSDTLRKLSSANDTGLTLMESIATVAETSYGTVAREFSTIHAKVSYGMSLKEALVAFNNRYHLPRLARTVKLISKAQEASSHISAVLSTAAQASENQDDIDRERKSRTRMQVVIIIMTFLTLLAVIAILKTQLLDVMAGLSDRLSRDDGPTYFAADPNLLGMMLFHAVTIQALLSGLISGYIRDGTLLSGVKYELGLLTAALLVWVAVG
jgi:flagellar protein FlaJ